MSKAVYYRQSFFFLSDEVKSNLFEIQTGHLSGRVLGAYRDFLELVYQSPIRISPQKGGDREWLHIKNMDNRTEVGLRVAERLYGVPFSHVMNT